MGGIEWPAIPTIVEIFGITDVETFITQLVAIRSWLDAQKG